MAFWLKTRHFGKITAFDENHGFRDFRVAVIFYCACVLSMIKLTSKSDFYNGSIDQSQCCHGLKTVGRAGSCSFPPDTANFRQSRLWVCIILILPLSLLKMSKN